jgi:class 3 adenylate cyclase
MSERGVADRSFEVEVNDLACVARQIGKHPFDLLGSGGSGIWAIMFAAREPASVRRLVLWSSMAGSYGPKTSSRIEAMLSYAERDWDLALETFAHSTVGWSRAREARQWAAFLKQSIKQEDFLRSWRMILKGIDLAPAMQRITSPTLILDSAFSAAVPRSHAKLLASGIANAQLLHLDPEAPFASEQGTRAVEEFLSDGQPMKAPVAVGPKVDVTSGTTAIILFADIADSTPLTERIGDRAFRERSRELDTRLRAAIREHGGTCIDAKTLGDGVLATFSSASQAIKAALACGRAGDDAGLPLHLGLHAGDVIREENNVFGGAVIIASRVSAMSAPGEVLVSATVRDLARTSAGVSFEDRGEQALKGVGEPVRVWAVHRE